MPTYKAPVEDVQFLLNDVFHIERYGNLPGFSDASPDIVAAILALLALASLRAGRIGIAVAWIFNIWGLIDLLNAFYEGNASGLLPGQLGAMYFLPTLVVPLLLVTHVLAFRILVTRTSQLPA